MLREVRDSIDILMLRKKEMWSLFEEKRVYSKFYKYKGHKESQQNIHSYCRITVALVDLSTKATLF